MLIIPSHDIYSIDNEKIANNSIKCVDNSLREPTIKDAKVYESVVSPSPWNRVNAELGNGAIKAYTTDYDINELASTKMVDFYVKLDNVVPSALKITFDLTFEIGVHRDGYAYPVVFLSEGVSTTNEKITLKYADFSPAKQRFIVSLPYHSKGTTITEGDGSSLADLNILANWENSNENADDIQQDVLIHLGIPSGSSFKIGNVSFTALVVSASVSVQSPSLDLSKTKVETIGEPSQNSFAIESSELNQDQTLYNGQIASVVLANEIIDNYKNGKETAVIRCSVPSDLSVYQIGDEVVPMVYGEDGEDRPMSLYKDGTPKVFRVVGTKFIYDGAVWQELTLQEVTNG